MLTPAQRHYAFMLQLWSDGHIDDSKWEDFQAMFLEDGLVPETIQQ